MDPTLRPRLIAALKAEMPALSPQLRQAAKYVIDHPSDFGLDPIRVSARKAGVSTYTLVKISKYMGFSGFEAFRQPFRLALISVPSATDTPDWLDPAPMDGTVERTHTDAVKNALSIVSRSLELQKRDRLDAATTMLIRARRVYLTAVRSSYAMAYYLHYVGRMALPTLELIPRHQNSAIDDLNDAQPGDVLIAITVTPYSRETIDACRFARKKGMKLLLLSDSEVVSPDLAPDHTLVATMQSTHRFGCFSGMLAVIEVLVAVLMHKGGVDATNRVSTYEAIRQENNAYWVAQKKH